METLHVTICNPLLRTPIALIVDDSCPVLNLTYYWINQRQAWKARFQPQVGFQPSDGDPAQMHRVPPTIPADFAVKWGEWCGEEGVKGKFSLVPYPAGVARVDRGFPGFPRQEFDGWMSAYRNIIQPNFDLTCEMLTHTHVVDLQTWQFTDAWEQYEWVDPPVEPLTDYIAAAMQLCRDAGLPCAGVTSPGAFGAQQEAAYARATLDAALRVNNDPRPFYFLHVYDPPDQWPDVPIWYADKEKGVAIASIVSCTHDWFGSWTGYDRGDPDLFIIEDLQGGRLPPILERELPCIPVGHWPGFYFGGEEVGFNILKEVKRRLDRYDPDKTKTIWMKTSESLNIQTGSCLRRCGSQPHVLVSTRLVRLRAAPTALLPCSNNIQTGSEIGHYWMARQLSDITTTALGEGQWQVQIATQFPTANFTLRLDAACARVQVAGADLQPVQTRNAFCADTFLVEHGQTHIAFALPVDVTTLHITLG